MSEPMVKGRHAAKAGYCSPGQARLIERFGLDPQRVYGEGYPVSHFKGVTNPLLKKVIDIAIAEHEQEQQESGKV